MAPQRQKRKTGKTGRMTAIRSESGPSVRSRGGGSHKQSASLYSRSSSRPTGSSTSRRRRQSSGSLVADGAPTTTPSRRITHSPLVGDRETEQLITKAGLVVEESRSSAQRSVRLLHESLEAGTTTASALHDQGKKLDHIEERLGEIEENVREARRNIRRIRSVFGGVANIFRDRKRNPKGKTTTKGSKRTAERKKSKHASKSSSLPSSPPVTSSRDQTHSTPPDPELNRCLDEMGDSLSKLKHLAVNMGDELSRQNEVLGRVVPKAQGIEEKVTRENRNARRLLL